MRVGTIKQIWRYPFKSMLGELLEHAQVSPQGVLGDRGWAVRDEVRGGISSAKKIPALMHCQARYPDSPTKEQIGPAEITVPDGTTFLSNDPEAAAQLSQALAHRVSIWPIQPAENLDHYRRGKPTHSNPAEELTKPPRFGAGRTPAGFIRLSKRDTAIRLAAGHLFRRLPAAAGDRGVIAAVAIPESDFAD